jgi:shikimate kinase
MWMRGESPVQWKNIFLTGLMGSGKSTVGRHLAARLGWTHVDTDKLIEIRDGRTVAQIFRESGEPEFRRQEFEALRECTMGQGQVVSLGGGTLTSLEALQLVSYSGVLVYLKTNLVNLVHRLMQATEKGKRPLLGEPDPMVWQEKLRTLLQQRKMYYEEADFDVCTDFVTPEEVAALIEVSLPEGMMHPAPLEADIC